MADGRDGGRFGSSDGNQKKVGWAWDPDHPGKGTQDTAPDSATPDGMLGGTGKPGDQGVPDVGAMAPSLEVPKSLRAAVDIAVILVQGDIAGAADDLISVARQLGVNATKKALSPFVLSKISGIVDRELPKAMEQLAKDTEFAAKSATEQTQIARQALQQETTEKLALELDSRAAGAEKAEKIDQENLAGPNAEYAKADLDEEQQTAEAAKRVREAVPDTNPASTVEPSHPPDPNATPGGRRTRIGANDRDPVNVAAIDSENESADQLARAGYEVEQNPQVPGSKNPDFRIEGKIFDNYAPTTSSARSIWTTVQEKIESGQAQRIVLNLGNCNVGLDVLKKQFTDWPISGLEEILVVKNGAVLRFWP